MDVFICSVFLIMSHVTVTTTTTTTPVTVVCDGASTITMAGKMAPNSVGLTTSSQHDVVLPLQLILRDTIRVSVGLTTVLQQQLQSQRPSQVHAHYVMVPTQVSFSFRSEPPIDSLY